MLAVIGDTFFVIFLELLKLFGGVLRLIYSENNWKCGMSAIQCADSADKTVVKLFKFLIGILLALYILVVRRGCGMS